LPIGVAHHGGAVRAPTGEPAGERTRVRDPDKEKEAISSAGHRVLSRVKRQRQPGRCLPRCLGQQVTKSRSVHWYLIATVASKASALVYTLGCYRGVALLDVGPVVHSHNVTTTSSSASTGAVASDEHCLESWIVLSSGKRVRFQAVAHGQERHSPN